MMVVILTTLHNKRTQNCKASCEKLCSETGWQQTAYSLILVITYFDEHTQHISNCYFLANILMQPSAVMLSTG